MLTLIIIVQAIEIVVECFWKNFEIASRIGHVISLSKNQTSKARGRIIGDAHDRENVNEIWEKI